MKIYLSAWIYVNDQDEVLCKLKTKKRLVSFYYLLSVNKINQSLKDYIEK